MQRPMKRLPMHTILVAAPEESRQRVHKTLDGHFRLIIVTSMTEACHALSDDVDAILCSVSFDDQRMFELLRFAKDNPRTRAIPFLCIKSMEGLLAPNLVQGIEMASRALGAYGLIDLYHLRMELGDEAAFAQLRTVIAEMVESTARDCIAPH